jgi:hypothetical protein
VGGVLFVADEDMAYLVTVFVEFVVYVQNRSAGIAENGIYSLLNQRFNQYARAGVLHLNLLRFLPQGII